MERNIVAVVFLNEGNLIAWFDNGASRRYTSKDLNAAGCNDFGSIRIGDNGASLEWNGDGSLAADALYEQREVVDYVESEKRRLLRSLSEIRRDASFSQTRLGEAAGIRQSVISRIEGCEISPQINTLLKLLAPLGKTLAIVDLKED
jgi:DNA-binding XRE family transcriptional regulator